MRRRTAQTVICYGSVSSPTPLSSISHAYCNSCARRRWGTVGGGWDVQFVGEECGGSEAGRREGEDVEQVADDRLAVDRDRERGAHAHVLERVVGQHRAGTIGHKGRLVAIGVEVEID